MKKLNYQSFKRFLSVPVRPLMVTILCGLTLVNPNCTGKEPASPAATRETVIPRHIVGLGRVEPEARIVLLSAEVPGLITGFSAQPGKAVKKGDIIAQLSDRIEKARVEQARSQILVQQSQIESARAALDIANAKLSSIKNNYLRLRKLVESEARSRSAFEQAEAEYNALAADISRLEANVSTARYRLDQLQAELHLARAQMAQKTIIAPTDGLLLSIDIPAGSYIAPGEAVGAFAPEGPLSAWCEIDELFADLIITGQKAIIRFPGRSENQGEGEVTFAGPWLRKKSIFSDDIGDLEDRRVREVRIRLNPGTDILPGSRVECVITLEK